MIRQQSAPTTNHTNSTTGTGTGNRRVFGGTRYNRYASSPKAFKKKRRFWWCSLYFLLTLLVVAVAVGVGFVATMLPSVEHTSGGLLAATTTTAAAGQDSRNDARSFADASIQEAIDIWSERKSNWVRIQQDEHNLAVEARGITTGPYSNSSLVLLRAEGVLWNTTLVQVFDAVTCPFFYLDSKVIERIPFWRQRQGGRLEVVESTLELYIPTQLSSRIQTRFPSLYQRFKLDEPIWTHTFRLLQAMDPSQHVLVSKSLEGYPDLSFAVRVEPVEDDTAVVVSMIHYTNLPLLPTILMNWINCNSFGLFFERITRMIEINK
jgi:hypothetical protein